MAKVLVLGASRGIGLETVKALLACGHSVRGLARGATDIGLDDAEFEPVAGDATDPDTVTEAVAGTDAAVMALGVRLRPATLMRPVTLFSAATDALVPAMRTAGVQRLIAVTGFGAGDSRAKISRLEEIPFRMILGRAYADKDRQEATIRASGLAWTLVRPGVLTSGARTGRYRVLVEPHTWRNGLISRADVADFVAGQVDATELVGEAPVIVY